jgi:phosphoribosyl-ATP pyrophosphohydrolase
LRDVTGFSLADLAAIIDDRARAADPQKSYTARLLKEGVARAAKKFGEEAVEAVIAAVEGDKSHLAAEAGDVLYHLLVMLKAQGVTLDEVMVELQRRTAESGIEEKAKRKPL